MNIQKSFITLLLALIIQVGTAQDFVYDWVRSAGGERWDLANDLVIDDEKNVYMAGGFEGTVFFGNDSLVSVGDRDIFIAKYNSIGNLQWLKSAGGFEYDNPIDIALDSENNILLTGNFQDSLLFDGQTVTAESFLNIFLAKLSPDGDLLNLLSVNANNRSEKLFLTPECDNIYLSGTYFDQLSVNGDTVKSSDDSDMFTISFKEDFTCNNLITYGNQYFGAQGNKSLKDIQYLDSTLYILCEFTDSIDIDGSMRYSFGSSDVLAMKTDLAGNILSLKQLAGFGEDEAKAMILDNDSNLYMAVEFESQLYFDQDSLISQGAKDIILLKTDRELNTIWHKQIGSQTNEYADNLLVNTINAVYLSGSFQDSLSIGNKYIISENNTVDMFSAKYSPEGDNQGLKQAGGSGHEYGNKLVNDQDNYLYIIGNFAYDFAFETDSISSDSIFEANNEDIFLARFYDCDYARFPEIGNDTSYCGYGSIEVLNPVSEEGSIFGNYKNYRWNTGQRGKQITVYDSGYYYVTTKDVHNCLVNSDSILVNILPEAIPDLGADMFVSPDEIITLNGGMFESYLWSNDSVTQTITFSAESLPDTENTFSLSVTNEFDCEGEDEILIFVEQPMFSNGSTEDNSNTGVNHHNYSHSNENTHFSLSEKSTAGETSFINKITGNAEKEVLTIDALVYPNPNKGQFKINLGKINEDIQSISIYSAGGKKVYESNSFDLNRVEISLDSRGSHYIIMETSNYLFFEKVIIQ
jgi:hypothetical protein